MKISPINYSYKSSLKQTKFASSRIVENFLEPKSELPKIPAEFFKAQLPTAKQYVYKPVASVKPVTEPVGHYDDLDKFSQLFADKINSQLLIPTEEDIENLIERIKKATGADEKLIRETLYNLTFFSGYQSFIAFNQLIQDKNICSFGIPYQFGKSDTSDFSSNGAINYLIANKQFLKYPIGDSDKPEKIGYILDDISLSQLEHYKNSTDVMGKRVYDTLKSHLLEKYVFIIPKGWNIKTENNGYKSANMFTGTGYLEDLAVGVIKRIQSGENPDRIYYSDFKERLYNLFDDTETKKKLNIIIYHGSANPKNLSNKVLLDLIKPLSISKEYVKKVLSSYFKVKKCDKSAQEAILKYLDEMTIAYSIDSLAVALKKMGKNIESMLRLQGHDKKDVIYLIPLKDKSYSLITAMYTNLNGINAENINCTTDIPEQNVKKAKVILDDISASGTSEGQNCLNIRTGYKIGKSPIIYAPVVMCSTAEDYTSRPDISRPDVYCFDKYISDMQKPIKLAQSIANPAIRGNMDSVKEELDEKVKKTYKLLTSEDCEKLAETIFPGYSANGLCVMFPYMIPDNASDIASLILRKLLVIENPATNKARGFLCSRNLLERRAFEDFGYVLRETDEAL